MNKKSLENFKIKSETGGGWFSKFEVGASIVTLKE